MSYQGICFTVVFFGILATAQACQQPCLFVSNTTNILAVRADLTSSTPVLRKLSRAVAVDVHVTRGLIFWSDVTEKRIKRANIDGSDVKAIVKYFIGVCDGLAVEWTTDLIYWSDTTLNNIEVARIDGSNRRTLISDNLDEPRGIAVDPLSRIIFWTDWGKQSKIERAYLNGANRRTIVSSSLGWPNDITLDHRFYKIYWVDAMTDKIESADYSGNHRTTLFHHQGIHPFSVDILSSSLFWTDWNTVQGVHKMNLSTGGVQSNVALSGTAMGLAVFDSSRQPSSINSCQQSNGGCSHLCLLKPSGHDCACPTGYGLGSDGRTCNTYIESFIIFTDANLQTTNIISLDVDYKTWKILYHHSNASRPIAIDYDPVDKRIYWTDVSLRRIASAFMNASSHKAVFWKDVLVPDGLAVDYLGRNLYWTDTGTNKIEVGRLDGSARKTLIYQNLDEPRAIALYAERGTMYWTDWGSSPKIETSYMDGTSRRVLFNTNLGWPNGLTIDKVNSKLYWADARFDKIEESDLSGSGRRVIISHSGIHPFGLTVFDGDLYWTDWTNKSVYSLNIVSGKQRRIASGMAKPMDIHAYNKTSLLQGSNGCSVSNGGCSHLCLPTPNGRTCACANGLSDAIKCGQAQACQQPCLFVSNLTNILAVRADLTSSTPVFHKLSRAVAVDVHVTRRLIFWSDVTEKRIKRANIDGSDVKAIVKYFIGVCDGLAVEWTTDLLYWSDTSLNNIEVARIDGSNRRTLISDNLDEPRGVAVDPLSRIIFWTDWGKQSKIERAYLNGANRRTIVSSSLGWPNDITLDHRFYKIYWVDAMTDKIESADYSGNHRTTLFHHQGIHPFSVDILSSSLFWTDWNTVQGVHKMNLSTGGVQSNVALSGTAMGLAVFDSSRQPSSINSCQQNNGGCSHLCLLKPSGHDCACPTGYGLGSDGRTCNTYIESFIIFTDANLQTTNIISLDVDYKTWKILYHHSNASRPIAIDYDPVDKRIYWTDVSLRRIASAFMNASSHKAVFWKDVLVPDGLAVDYLGRNLYWTDTGTNKIEVGRLDGSARKTLIYQNLDEPRAIALYAERGTMYWTDWGSSPKIETSYMDGTSRRVLFNTNLGWPNGLTIDKVNSKLYWADARFDKIEESDLSGSGRRVIISHSGIHPFGLTVFDGDLYWTDWTNKSVYSLNIVSGKQRRIASGMAKPMDIHAYNKTSLLQGSNGCSVSNGGCSHLCLPTPNGRTCACANGLSDAIKCGQAQACQQPCLFVSNLTNILAVRADLTSSTPVFHKLSRAVAVDVHVTRRLIFWSDVTEKRIKRANIDGSDVKAIVKYFIGVCDGLAVEWTTDLLYWSDTSLNNIEVARIDGSNRRTLISDNLDEPRGVAVDPLSRIIFWTDWGKQSKIERAYLNGANRRTIVSSSLGWPNDITLDHRFYKIYWVDAMTDKIESADYSGNHRTTLFHHQGIHPFSVDILSSSLFWTDWNTVQGVHKMNLSTGGVQSNVALSGTAMGLAVFDSSRQPSSINSCQQSNGGCSHLCLLKPSGHDCACPTGYGLGSDGRTCNTYIESFIIFTDANLQTTNIISLDVDYKTWKILYHHSNASRPIAIDYDPVDKRIYWTDVSLRRIASAFMNASSHKAVFWKDVLVPEGLAVDYLGRNLYWTDTGTNKIEVGRLDGSARKTLIYQNLDEPRAIALYAERGTMYWTDWGSSPKIETSYMDGTSRRVLFNTNLGWPNGLTIDKVNSKLYWADARFDKIEESDLSGSGRRVIISHSGIHPFGLTVFDGDLYWTDWTNKSVYSLNIVSGKQRRIASGMAKPMDIHAYNKTSLLQGSNGCSVSNGGCSHLCLPTPNGRTCACANGLSDATKCGQVSVANCSAPTLKPNSVLITPHCGRHIGATCSFACQSGYSLVGGTTTITCRQNGTWTGEGPTCSAMNCTSPNVAGVLRVTGCNSNYGGTCNFTCPAGYRLIGMAMLTCVATNGGPPGVWNGAVPTCQDTQTPVFVSCPKDILVYAERGTTSSMVTWAAPSATDNSGEAPSITRVNGYSPPVRLNQGVYQVTYSATDRANNKALCSFKITVQAINCTSPNLLGVLRLTGCNNYYGGTCNFTCPVGYRLVGMTTLTCLATNGGPPGAWNGAVPSCQALTCQALRVPANAIRSGCSGLVNERIGTVCQFQCIHGYRPSIVVSRICQQNGTWSGSDLTCSAVMCPPLTKPIHGTVAPASCLQYSHYSSICGLSCDHGFRIGGTTSRTCTSNSIWTGNNDTRCEDITPPTFSASCPNNKVYDLDRCSNSITVNWTIPIATDNSGVVRIVGPSHGPPLTLLAGIYTINYTAIDPTGNSRRCSFKIQVNGHVCRHLTNPVNGFITSLTCNNGYGSVATFSCRSGYTLSGSRTRSCLVNGQWSGVDTTCIKVTCPALRPLNFGTIEPRNCHTGLPVVSGTWCLFKCNFTNGYRNVGPDRATCTQNGTWSEDVNKISCEDYVPPSLQCPQDAKLTTDPGKGVSTFRWTVPTPTDNSGDQPSLTVKPDGISPPHEFPVGKRIVDYTAKDSSNLKTRCSFTVTVRDNEAPRKVYCPPGFQVTSKKRSTQVYFPRAKFIDNVGVTSIITDRQNGSKMSYGEHNVTYTAYDRAGNTATCVIQIIVSSISCKKPDHPKHGALSCLTLTGGMYCTVHCFTGYVFAMPERLQICTDKGKWLIKKVPDCTESGSATISLKGILHYIARKCQSMKDAIKRQFMTKMQEHYMGNMHCTSDSKKCKLKNVKVTCWKARKRRSVDDNNRVDISFEMELPFVKNASADMNNTVAELKSSVMETINKSLSKLEVDGQVITLDKSSPSTLKFVSLTCGPGQVLKGAVCVKCPSGYFLSSSTKSCSPCPANQYQELEGQTSCKTCPSGTSGAEGETGSASKQSCLKGTEPESPITMIASVVVSLVVAILVLAIVVWILKRRQCICNEKSPEIREDHERIVYGPKVQEERHGPSIINPSYDESSFASHIYAEVGDPIRIYANVKDDTSIQGQNLGLRFENPAYENTGFSNRVSQA